MEAFTTLDAIAAPLPEPNIDTDVIFPARFLLITEKAGLGRYAFHDKRFRADGSADVDFILNRPPFDSARMLVTGDHFGCGSSREQAPWALHDFGIRCIVSSRFGEIFEANCVNNGILPAVVNAERLDVLLALAARGERCSVSLPLQQIVCAGEVMPFEITAARRDALLQGRDEITSILHAHGAAIDAFEARQRGRMPWLHDQASLNP
jgi:3-isopropylmalate/(R)-2-methylmalate dehydratase small subunit